MSAGERTGSSAPTPRAGGRAPEEESRVLAGVPKGLLIDGRWRPAGSGRELEVEDPATGVVLASVADAGTEDAVAALDAAARSQKAWAASAPRERGEVLRRAFEAMVEAKDDLALLMTLEMGKPLDQSAAEVLYAAEFFRWFSEEAVRVCGQYSRSSDGSSRVLTMRQPVGPCVLVTPWNFPLAMGTRKIGPAIAAGCTMVVKPAAQTPLSMLALAQILMDCGLPPGVCNVVTSSSPSSVVRPLLEDGRTRKLSFTGSTEVGRLLMSQAAPRLLRTSMELGGNAPFVVFEDADLDAVVEGALIAKMRNMGEACTAANRFLAAAPVAEELSERLSQRMAKMSVGRGTEPGVEVGPLIDERAREKVEGLVKDAASRGARVLTGGAALEGPGHFYSPTVLSSVPRDSAILTQEVFGPVAPVVSFSTEEEALSMANATDQGLVAYLYTSDISRALRIAEGLETGMVGLNQGMVSNAGAPFGGVKQSGFGREGGREGIEEYLELKYVALHV